jgi:UTP-glucose-1-phosphate uridylyltransferase
VEKPTIEFARANMVTPGLPVGQYLTVFGLYVITESKLFDILADHQAVREQLGPSGGLLQLTPALDQIRAEAGLNGVLLDGERYDIGGDPQTYLTMLNRFAPQFKPPSAAPLS